MPVRPHDQDYDGGVIDDLKKKKSQCDSLCEYILNQRPYMMCFAFVFYANDLLNFCQTI